MELYVLDAQLRRIAVIDHYKSLIWTERYSTLGDFEMVIRSSRDIRALLAVDVMVAVNTSKRVMIVKNVEDKADDDGTSFLTISGPSLERIMKDRVVKDAPTALVNINKGTATMTIASPCVVTRSSHGLVTGDLLYFSTTGALPTNVPALTGLYAIVLSSSTFKLATTEALALAGTAINSAGSQSGVHTLWKSDDGKWTFTDLPADILRDLFDQICVDGVVNAGDIIPFMTPGSLYTPGTIPEPEDEVTIDFAPADLYTATKQVADVFNLGFRLVRNFDESELYYDIYSGSDRTTQQDDLAPVVFSPELDNLSDMSEFTSVEAYKNVAYVMSPNAFRIVYAEGADSTTIGFARKVLFVDASDVELSPGSELDAILEQRGQAALAENKSIMAFDGEIPQFGSYIYEYHYFLGDLVEVRNNDGVTNNMRVTEQIFVHDEAGERSYPTLAIDILITPGSWLAWESNEEWDDVDDSEHWDDLP